VKYNRLMDIEDELKASGEDVVYAGTEFRTAHSAGGKEEGAKVPFNVFGY
jgi:enolase